MHRGPALQRPSDEAGTSRGGRRPPGHRAAHVARPVVDAPVASAPFIALVALLLAPVGGCDRAIQGSDDAVQTEEAADDPRTLPASRYCEEVVSFFCPFYLRCGRMAVDDLETCHAVFLEACNARYAPSYEALADAGLLALDPAGIDACQAHLETVPCAQQIFDTDGPCGDMWRGTQPAGAACGFDPIGVEAFVCAPGTRCVLSFDGAGGEICGVCEAVVSDGASCAEADVTCGARSTCLDGTCQARRAVGESCGSGQACQLGARCVAGVCAPRAYAPVGEACDAETRCPYAAACIGGVCVASSELGEPCGPDRACDSGTCAEGVCVAFRPQGDTCEADAQCQSGACEDDGTCRQLPGACFSRAATERL